MKENVQNGTGSVLIFVLLFMALFLFLGSMYARHSLIEAKVAYNYTRNIQAYYEAEGGLEVALAILQGDESLLDQDFILGGSVKGGYFNVSGGGVTGGGKLIISQGGAFGGKETIHVEVRPGEIGMGQTMVARGLALRGMACIGGSLHVNGPLVIHDGENCVTGGFSYSGEEAVFGEGASLMLEDSQLTATGPADLAPFRVASPLSACAYNKDFYEGKGFQSFPGLQDYLMHSYSPGEYPKAMILTEELNTAFMEGNFSYHGVIIVNSSLDISLSGHINAGEPHGGKQMIIVAARGQDIHIGPNSQGELNLGGTFIILTAGDVFLTGPLGAAAADSVLAGAVACRLLSLNSATLLYSPQVCPDLEGFLKGLTVLHVSWLKNH